MVALDWHVFVGSDIGLLKGVDIKQKKYSNLNFSLDLHKDDEITAMCWEDSSERKICIGQKNQTVKIYDCESKLFTISTNLKVGEGAIRGLHYYNGQILTAVESGIVKLWNENLEENFEINTGGNLCKMIANPLNPNHIATGGYENDLKVWDLERQGEPIFRARNVQNDHLDVQVPVWISDMKFTTNNKIVTCTRHHQIRLYDLKTQNRPVKDIKFECSPLMCISLAHNENHVIVGTREGRMVLIDLRILKEKDSYKIVHAFKGFSGSIRCVQCHPMLPLVASCGLDKHLRIHDLNKKKLIKKIYLKQSLNCLLIKNSVPDIITHSNIPKLVKNKNVCDIDEENTWKSMPVVKENSKKRKSLDKIHFKNIKQECQIHSKIKLNSLLIRNFESNIPKQVENEGTLVIDEENVWRSRTIIKDSIKKRKVLDNKHSKNKKAKK